VCVCVCVSVCVCVGGWLGEWVVGRVGLCMGVGVYVCGWGCMGVYVCGWGSVVVGVHVCVLGLYVVYVFVCRLKFAVDSLMTGWLGVIFFSANCCQSNDQHFPTFTPLS